MCECEQPSAQRRRTASIDCRCLQTHAEFFVLAPAAAEHKGVEFLLFRVASAEEVLVPPPRTRQHSQQQQPVALGPDAASAEEAIATAALASIRAISRDDFNPFRYESGLAMHDTAEVAPSNHHRSAAAAARATAVATIATTSATTTTRRTGTTRVNSASFAAAIDQRITSRTKSAAGGTATSATRMQTSKRKKLL